MRWFAVTLILATSMSLAASRCPDPRLRQAAIGGDAIRGGVLLHKKPLKFAQVRLYFSSGETAWVGTTDQYGAFTTDKLLPGDYRLEVSGWGSTRVRVNPELDRGFGGQTPTWSLLLSDNACVGTSISMD